MSAVAKISDFGKIETVLMQGDLSRLNEGERLSYYKTVCESLGLNPLTKPFDYIQLNGKLTLYAKKDCTEQLRKVHKVSLTISSREKIGDVYVVTARAKLPDGREDESTGVVPLASLRGDALANAFMKAETKAKRRVTLSICGLGILDETEVETIPPSQPEPKTVEQPKQIKQDNVASPKEETPLQHVGLKAFQIPFGKYKKLGLKLGDIAPVELEDYAAYLREGVKKNEAEGKNTSGAVIHALDAIDAFLMEIMIEAEDAEVVG